MAVPEISVDELAERMRAGATVIDVREPNEWVEVRAAGVSHIPLGQLTERVGELPEGEEICFICRSGGRSMRAAEWAVARGHSAVNVSGGTTAWVERNLPTETG